jgi:transcriptional antiterminator NusG
MSSGEEFEMNGTSDENQGDSAVTSGHTVQDGVEQEVLSGKSSLSSLDESPSSADQEVASPGARETAEADSEADPAPEKPVNPNLRWYVVNAYSGFEAKAKKSLEERIRTHDLEKYFGDVYVPEETVIELVKGEKKTSTRKFFPGYMLVQMEMNQDTWHLVKETPKISGFIGDATDPSPLSEEEVARVLSQVEEGAAAPKSRITFTEGEAIKVIDGPFAEFSGTVEEVRPDKGKVRVLVSIFGRATPLDLDFVQVEKIS